MNPFFARSDSYMPVVIRPGAYLTCRKRESLAEQNPDPKPSTLNPPYTVDPQFMPLGSVVLLSQRPAGNALGSGAALALPVFVHIRADAYCPCRPEVSWILVLQSLLALSHLAS